MIFIMFYVTKATYFCTALLKTQINLTKIINNENKIYYRTYGVGVCFLY